MSNPHNDMQRHVNADLHPVAGNVRRSAALSAGRQVAGGDIGDSGPLYRDGDLGRCATSDGSLAQGTVGQPATVSEGCTIEGYSAAWRWSHLPRARIGYLSCA